MAIVMTSFETVTETEKCGCSVTIYSLLRPDNIDLVIRDRVSVAKDCPHHHTLGAKIVSGGRSKMRRRDEQRRDGMYEGFWHGSIANKR